MLKTNQPTSRSAYIHNDMRKGMRRPIIYQQGACHVGTMRCTRARATWKNIVNKIKIIARQHRPHPNKIRYKLTNACIEEIPGHFPQNTTSRFMALCFLDTLFANGAIPCEILIEWQKRATELRAICGVLS